MSNLEALMYTIISINFQIQFVIPNVLKLSGEIW